jgi:antibiotic biosynthesis monooxygenase (ABM) superfamily enzyme
VIARTWRGWATLEAAEDYELHYRSEVAEHLRGIPGFVDARLLRHIDGDEVAFTSIVVFADMDSVRAFAGDQPRVAVVEDAARAVLARWDERVTHHDIAVSVV